jgi:hypothetical protein
MREHRGLGQCAGMSLEGEVRLWTTDCRSRRAGSITLRAWTASLVERGSSMAEQCLSSPSAHSRSLLRDTSFSASQLCSRSSLLGCGPERCATSGRTFAVDGRGSRAQAARSAGRRCSGTFPSVNNQLLWLWCRVGPGAFVRNGTVSWASVPECLLSRRSLCRQPAGAASECLHVKRNRKDAACA